MFCFKKYFSDIDKIQRLLNDSPYFLKNKFSEEMINIIKIKKKIVILLRHKNVCNEIFYHNIYFYQRYKTLSIAECVIILFIKRKYSKKYQCNKM